MKLERIGNTFNAYQSPDGSSWMLVGSDTIAMAATVYIGLAATSHSTMATATAQFDYVNGTGFAGAAPPPPPPPPPPPTPLPTGWSHQDIGAVGASGAAGYDDATATFSVNGAGADVWGTADALHYAYTTLDGNGTIVARVTSVQNTNAWTKAGVMIRESTDPGAAQAFMLVSSSKGQAYQRRPATGGASASTTGPATGRRTG